MRTLPFTLFFTVAFALPVAAQAPDAAPPRQTAPPAAATASPFLEFQAAGAGPRASSKSVTGHPRKPPFEMTISTPVTNFAHMRRGPSNTTLECIIPADLRRD